MCFDFPGGLRKCRNTVLTTIILVFTIFLDNRNARDLLENPYPTRLPALFPESRGQVSPDYLQSLYAHRKQLQDLWMNVNQHSPTDLNKAASAFTS